MKKLLFALVITGVMAITGFVVSGQASAQAGCDDYAIMRCGATSAQQFINKARANAPGDLQAIYSNFGLTPNEYDRFANQAKRGTLYNDGRIVVDGRVVGHSTMNVGRVRDGSFNKRVTINGKNYWGGHFGSTYHANRADVMVLFNDRGVMEFVAVSSCGNPQRFTPNKPNYSCDKLKKTRINAKENRYRFTTDATAAGGAEVVKVVYDFGDGNSKTTRSLSEPVEHSFKKTSTVRVTVHVKLPGGGTDTVTAADCATRITVTPPEEPEEPEQPNPQAMCSNLTGTLINAEQRSYRFVAQAQTSGGAKLVDGDFSFGDGVNIVAVRPNGNQVIINHTYAKPGDYTVVATLHFTGANNQEFTVNCNTAITAADTTEYCRPGIPVGSKECEGELIKAGPGTIIAGIVGGSGTLAAAGHYFIRRRLLGL